MTDPLFDRVGLTPTHPCTTHTSLPFAPLSHTCAGRSVCVRCAQYVSECRSRGVCDLYGLRLHSAWSARCLSAHERAALSAAAVPMEAYRVYRACAELMERNGCVRCWLQRHCCLCDCLPPLPARFVAPHRLVVLLHHLEFARASNTGKLMLRAARSGSDDSGATPASASSVDWAAGEPLSSPLFGPAPSFNADGVMLLVAGLPAHDTALERICSADGEGLRTLVLFPSRDAVTVQQHMQRAHSAAAAATGAATEAETTEAAAAQTIIVVDGTYSQAAQLVRRIPPHIPRVRLAHCQRTADEYQQYVQAVQRRMAHTADDDDDDSEVDEESTQSDVHRRGKQWRGAGAEPSSSFDQSPASSDGSPAFLSSSFFTAVRRQPQGDRVSSIEAIAFCLFAIKLHSPATAEQPLVRTATVTATATTATASVPFPTSVLDSLLLLVDALRLQAGQYQQYRTHSRRRRRRIKHSRGLLYKRDEQPQRMNARQPAVAAVELRGLCTPFNRSVGCDKRACKYSHRCGHCGSEHSFVRCPQVERASGSTGPGGAMAGEST